jgi:hypothetical protein
MTEVVKEFNSLAEFYPFYLSEHSNSICRKLHYIGSTAVLTLLAISLITQNYSLLFVLPLVGYGPAWVGHFFFEGNKPATFKYPLYSFLSDWIMLKDACLGRIK